MKLKPYPEYKDSGIQWIGKIPKGWKFNKIKHNVLALEKSGMEASEGNEEGEYPFFTSSQVQNKFIDKAVFNNECLILGTGGMACIHYVNGKFSASTDCLVLKKQKNINFKFLYYQILSNINVIDDLGFWGMGLRHLQKDFFYNMVVYWPIKEEQQKIVEYLDSKISKINQTIEKDKKLIALLKEKRTALINHAVTKGLPVRARRTQTGLDQNVKLKDSGIPWIGEIPEKWEVRRLRFNALVNPSGKKALSDPKLLVNFLPMEKVSENGEYDTESKAEYQDVSSGYTYFEDNDILVAKITPCFENGKGTLVNNLEYGFGFGTTEFHVIRSYDQLDSKYLFYLTKTHLFRVTGEAFMEGAAGQKRVSTDFVKNFIMVTPPKQEQLQIVQYLDKATSKIDKTIKLIEKKIKLLEEYKKSLIHHTVTGKMDVRRELKCRNTQ